MSNQELLYILVLKKIFKVIADRVYLKAKYENTISKIFRIFPCVHQCLLHAMQLTKPLNTKAQ